MVVTPDIYVPALKWRMGEYQALLRLSDAAKARIKPLLMIPKIEFDFDEWKPPKTVQKHVEPFGRRYKAKWKTRPAWVDVDPTLQTAKLDSGVDVITHVFAELRKFKAEAVPVASLDCHPDALHALAAVVRQDGKGVALRARLEHLMKSDFMVRVADTLGTLKLAEAQVDLVIDFGAPTYEPYDAFCGAFLVALKKIPGLGAFRSFVVMGTGFPESMKGIGKAESFSRHEWLFYKKLIDLLPQTMRRPSFGDYTIVHPNFTPLDMRKIKSAGKIVYATKDNKWAIEKGRAFRDNPEQMHDLCAHLVGSGMFRGKDFSEGDDYIDKCARKEVGPSNQPRWKQIGINHHIMQVLEDLSNVGGPA